MSTINLPLLALAIAPLVPAQADAPQDDAVQTITRASTQASIAGPDAYFTGRARVDPLTPANEHINAGVAYVTFEPGARSAWHTHPLGQYLVVTAGVGRTQYEGGAVETIRPGDVIWCPPGVRHWHGAAPDTAMTHLSIAGTRDGKNVEWMEKVTDAQYLGK